jgi:hypothetical protein
MSALDCALRARSVQPVVAPPERGSRWDPEIFSILSFGQLPTALDALWIDILLDERVTKVPRWAHAKIYYDLDLLTRLDPAFFEAYHAGANLLAVIRDDINGAKELVIRGNDYRKQSLSGQSADFQQRFWPHPWSIPMIGGYIELFEENNLPMASYFFKEAGSSPDAPLFLHELEKRLARPGGEYEVGLRSLNFMALAAPNREAKEALLEKRRSLLVDQFLYDVNRGFDEFLSSDRKYRNQASVSPAQMEKYWRQYIKSLHASERDPWGGRLFLEKGGRVNTSTPHEKVFGLDGRS